MSPRGVGKCRIVVRREGVDWLVLYLAWNSHADKGEWKEVVTMEKSIPKFHFWGCFLSELTQMKFPTSSQLHR